MRNLRMITRLYPSSVFNDPVTVAGLRAATVLGLAFLGEPDLMDAIIQLIGRF